jgi:hypothetical protein
MQWDGIHPLWAVQICTLLDLFIVTTYHPNTIIKFLSSEWVLKRKLKGNTVGGCAMSCLTEALPTPGAYCERCLERVGLVYAELRMECLISGRGAVLLRLDHASNGIDEGRVGRHVFHTWSVILRQVIVLLSRCVCPIPVSLRLRTGFGECSLDNPLFVFQSLNSFIHHRRSIK